MNTKTQVTDDTAPGTVVVRETGRGQFQRGVISGPHRLLADEPASVGRLDSGPGPYEFLLAALVRRFSQIDGYRCLSLIRALAVVNCQSALA